MKTYTVCYMPPISSKSTSWIKRNITSSMSSFNEESQMYNLSFMIDELEDNEMFPKDLAILKSVKADYIEI